MEKENKKRRRRPYSKENMYKYNFTLNYMLDGLIIDELYAIEQDPELSQLIFMKYAVVTKINRKKSINTIHLKSKQSKYIDKNVQKTVTLSQIDEDLTNVLEPLKLSKKAGSYIKEALYELIEEGYTKEQLKEFKQSRKKLREKNPIIMKPQLSLYEKNEKDMTVKNIINYLDKIPNEDRDEYIKDAIIEKYNRDFN